MRNCSKVKTGTCASPVNPQPKSNFGEQVGRKDNLKSNCRSCEREYTRLHGEKNRARAKKWHHENKYRSKLSKIKKNYGLSSGEYEKMVEEHKGKCPICKKDSFLVVDHCHTTSKVRGLICHTCNRGLGMFYDDVKMLRAAIKYLE